MHKYKTEALRYNISNCIFPGFILPITYDTKRIYKLDDNTENNILSQELDEESIFYKNDIKEEQYIQKIEDEYTSDNISFKEYIRELNKIHNKAYQSKDDKGISIKAKHNFDSLRYYDMDTIHWNIKRSNDDMCILVEEDNYSFKKECLIQSDNTTIIGFVILKQDYKSIYDIYNSQFKYSKFTYISNISNITISKNGVFTCKSHNLNNGSYLLIKNSTLAINGVYKTSLNVINNDTFTLNIDTTKFKVKDNLGELYSIKSLNIKTHKLGNKNININNKQNNIILFDKKLNLEDYNNIIEACIPKTLNYVMNLISKETNLYEILNLYYIFHIKQWNKLDNNDNIKFLTRLNKKVNKLIKLYKNVTLDFKKENKKSITDLVVSDKIFFAKEITDNYGIYQLKGAEEDSDYLRLNWINRQADLGLFYYKYVIKVIYKDYDRDKIQKIINLYKKKLDDLKKHIGISNNYDTYEVKSLDEINEPKKGDIAIIKSDDDNDGNIYVYNTKWSFVKTDSSQTIEELCMFKTQDLKKLKLRDITSEYIEEQCNNRKAHYYKNEYQETLHNYNELLSLQSQGKLKDTLENEYEMALKKLKLLQYKYEYELKENKKTNNKNKKNKQQDMFQVFIVNKINTLHNRFYVKYFIYRLLDLDGIEINNIIYSKKFKMPLICGHWKYLKQFEYASTLNEKNRIGNKLLDIFCDESDGYKYCKICGELLNLVDYDEVDGFTSDGHIKVSRTVMEENKEIKNMNQQILISDCSINNIRNLLIKKGIGTDRLKSVLDICNIIKLITEKIGLSLKEKDFLMIILESNTLITDIISFSKFKKIKINLLIKQGKEKVVPKLEQTDYFKNIYLEYYNLNKYCIISCLILLIVQSSVPKYILKNSRTVCSLSSIDGRDGINYMSCIIKEAGVLNYEIESSRGKKKTKKITDSEIYEEMEKKYYEFIEKSLIKNLFKKKDKYNEKIVKKSNKVKYVSKNKEEPDKLPGNFSDYILGKKGDQDIKKDYIKYYQRYKYVNLEIMRIIHHVISTSELESSVIIQNTCCSDITDNSYLDYIIKENKDIESLIEESKELLLYDKLFNGNGTLTTMYPFENTYEETHNYEIVDSDIRKKTMLYYNCGNLNAGLKRIYLGNVNNKYDIISNRYKKDILKDDIDENIYNQLLLDIQSKNTIFYKKIVKEDISKYYDSLKYFDYISKIDSLVNKLTVYLKKDDLFKKELKEKLRRIGLKDMGEKNTLREKILDETDIYVNKIHNLKSYINDYFRKYINLVKNKYLIKNLPTIEIDDPKDKEVLQKLLIDDYHYFKDFFPYAKIFKDIKFDYSIDEINKFIGTKNLYSNDWKKIKIKSKYPFRTVSEMLHFILINQLDSMLYQKESVEINNKTISGETINIMLSEFIYKVLEKIENDYNKVNVDENRYNQYRQCLYYQNNKFRYKVYNEGGKELLKEMYGETDKEALDDKIKEFKEDTREKYKEAQEEVNGMIEGKDLSEQEVSDLIDDVLYEDKVDEEERDEYDISQSSNISETLEEEDDYGELLDENGINQGELEEEMEEL